MFAKVSISRYVSTDILTPQIVSSEELQKLAGDNDLKLDKHLVACTKLAKELELTDVFLACKDAMFQYMMKLYTQEQALREIKELYGQLAAFDDDSLAWDIKRFYVQAVEAKCSHEKHVKTELLFKEFKEMQRDDTPAPLVAKVRAFIQRDHLS